MLRPVDKRPPRASSIRDRIGFDVPMQEPAFEWLPRHFSVRTTGRGRDARLSPDSRLLLCRALPRRVVFGETIQTES